MSVNQIKVVIARAASTVSFERREMVLQVDAGLSAFDSATEAESTAAQIEKLRVAAASMKKLSSSQRA